jgi:hypothetical protein
VRGNDQNLDPLLDTMANVVGILVMMVAVTQLSIGEAVERISDRGAARIVPVEEMAEARREKAELENAIVNAEGSLDALRATAKRRGMLLSEAEAALESLEAMAGRDDIVALETREAVAALEREERDIEKLRAALTVQRDRLLELDALIQDLPDETRPKIARLPNPHPPPAGANEIAFVCRYGRIQPIDLEEMRRMLRVGIAGALGSDRGVGWNDRPWLRNLFDKLRVGTENFRWRFGDSDESRLFADITWHDESSGETAGTLREGGSDHADELGRLARRGNFIRYYVWADSFDVYLEARYQAESAGFDVSWLVVDAKDDVGIDLRGSQRKPILID